MRAFWSRGSMWQRPGVVVLLVIAASLGYSCHGAHRATQTGCSTYGSPGSLCVQFDTPFVLDSLGRYLPPGDFRIGLDSVVEDSRCPTGVQCVWAGRARVRLRVDSSNYMRVVELRTDSATMRVFSHTITLDSLLPYPRSGESIDRRQYRAWVHVSRAN